MSSITTLRHLALAAALVLPASLAAQTEVRVMPFVGVFPFVAGQTGVHVQLSPGGGSWSVFAEYEIWVWGFTCHPHYEGPEGRCGDEGNGFHAGVTKHLASRSATWRPFIAAGAGYAEPVGDADPGLSLLGEGGVDIGWTRRLSVRLSIRRQGPPRGPVDFGAPALGLQLRL